MLGAWTGKNSNGDNSPDKNSKSALPPVSREERSPTIGWVKNIAIGGVDAMVMAGPCSLGRTAHNN